MYSCACRACERPERRLPHTPVLVEDLNVDVVWLQIRAISNGIFAHEVAEALEIVGRKQVSKPAE